jgi:predicted nucleotidyltransferase component of viral defense system
MIYKNILSQKQIELLSKLQGILPDCYMAGGTALALQLGHRTSLDFDFYTRDHFEIEKILANFQKSFKKVKVERVVKDTLILEVEDVSLSIFYYPYNLIKPLVHYSGVNLASIEDIAAMKMVAISMRGKRRDFVDGYYLLKTFTLDEIIKLTLKKYPSYQSMVILKGLIYFKDAEKDDISRKIKIFDDNFSWDTVKNKILDEVEKYQENILK